MRAPCFAAVRYLGRGVRERPEGTSKYYNTSAPTNSLASPPPDKAVRAHVPTRGQRFAPMSPQPVRRSPCPKIPPKNQPLPWNRERVLSLRPSLVCATAGGANLRRGVVLTQSAAAASSSAARGGSGRRRGLVLRSGRRSFGRVDTFPSFTFCLTRDTQRSSSSWSLGCSWRRQSLAPTSPAADKDVRTCLSGARPNY